MRRLRIQGSCLEGQVAAGKTTAAKITATAVQAAGEKLLADIENSEILKEETKAELRAEVVGMLESAADVQAALSEFSPAPGESSSLADCTDYMKLERLKLSTFSGDYREWKSWYEAFVLNVHENSKYNKQAKFSHLKKALAGEALGHVKHLTVTSENYDKALKVLLDEYNNPQLTVAAYRRELEELAPASDDFDDQSSKYAIINSILANIRELKTEESEDDLRSEVLRKFPEQLVVQAFLHGKLDYTSRTEQLLTAIKVVLEVRRWVNTMTARKRDAPQSGASTCMMTGSSSTAEGTGQNPSKKKKFASPGKAMECVFCAKTHKSLLCRGYRTLTARRDRLAALQLCFVCLQSGHKGPACPSRSMCKACNGGFHNVVICSAKIPGGKGEAEATPTKPSGKAKFLQTVICTVCSDWRSLPVRGILDNCSDSSYIRSDLVRRLGAPLGTARASGIQTLSNVTSIPVHDVKLRILSRSGRSIGVNFLAIDHVPGSVGNAPPASELVSILPSGIDYADPDLFNNKRGRIELLFGIDVYHELVHTNGHKRLPCGIVLLNSVFGRIPSGMVQWSNPTDLQLAGSHLSSTGGRALLSANTSSLSGRELEDGGESMKLLSLKLERLWDLESLGIRETEFSDPMSNLITNFERTTRFEDGRYVVCWPRKTEVIKIPTNYRMCVARLRQMLQRSPSKWLDECLKLFQQQLNTGIIEKAPISTTSTIHYVPYKLTWRNEKPRVVYDASAKTKTGQSLNDQLHAGPSLISNLVGILIGFRLKPIALTADIEKMFNMVGLDEADRDLVRFLWVEDHTKSLEETKLIVFRFKRLPFGVISSPFLLNMVMRLIWATALQSSEGEEAECYEIARKNFYVDNLITSVDTPKQAIAIYDNLVRRLAAVGMNLREWTSNCDDLLKVVAADKLLNQPGPMSVLGLNWDRSEDTISLKFESESKITFTKRSALATYAEVYDPLGLMSPCILALKLFVQECWVLGYTWDDSLSPLMEARFRKLLVERDEIRGISIPRMLWSSGPGKCRITLHTFCDASKSAYGCVHYLVKQSLHTKSCESALLFSKVRLSPRKQRPVNQLQEKPSRPLNAKTLSKGTPNQVDGTRSIPQLELLGVTTGVRTVQLVRSLLDVRNVNIDQVYVWTDATTVVQWLHSANVLPLFVENRVREIRKVPGLIIRYVPTKDNPADILSRGKPARELKESSLWWSGPSWLTDERLWPETPTAAPVYTTGTQVTLATSNVDVKVGSSLLSDALEKRYLHWECIVKAFARLRSAFMKLFRALLLRKQNREDGNMVESLLVPSVDSVTEHRLAETALLRAIQLKYFKDEIMKLENNIQPNPPLGLFLDKNGLIRCRGRLLHASLPWEAIHPVYLPYRSKAVEVLMYTIHSENCHIGATQLLSKFRERFWINKGRTKAKSIVARCRTCRRLTGGPYRLPPMPSLPKVRVADVTPFLYIGVDCFGPYYISQPNTPSLIKVYGLIFVCLVTRAIWLEVLYDMSGDQFLMAFERFASRRGCPLFVISDNGSNFTFAQPLLSKRVNLHEMKIHDPKVASYFLKHRIRWSFIPAYSPWYGGAYERLIGVVKASIKKALGKALVDFTVLTTLFCKVEDITNSRPLTYVSSDETIAPITPNHFIRLRSTAVTDETEVDLTQLDLEKIRKVPQYKAAIHAIETYREAFYSLYLQSLREAHVASHRHPKGSVRFKPEPGVTVVIKDDKAPRSRWLLGTIRRVDPRGGIADVEVKSGTTALNKPLQRTVQTRIIQRVVSRLYPIELPPEECASVTGEPSLASSSTASTDTAAAGCSDVSPPKRARQQ